MLYVHDIKQKTLETKTSTNKSCQIKTSSEVDQAPEHVQNTHKGVTQQQSKRLKSKQAG